MRILVVDDEPRMASVLSRSLTEDGYAVDVAVDGADALWRAGGTSYDAILLDVMLPGDNGYAVCRKLRDQGCWAPILMVTARDNVSDRIRGLDGGADDYLTKPVNLRELSARVRALLRRAAPQRPSILRVDTLSLDPSTREVRRDDSPIPLTAREFGLLELLMRNPGVVLSRIRLLEGNWDQGIDAASNLVDQYVGYLRRKVDRPFGVEQIETARGAGYRLLTQARPTSR